MMKSIAAVAALLLPTLTIALDVQISGFTCDDSLPFSLSAMAMKCNGENRCTFGETSVLYGELMYNGTLDAGVMDDTVYATAGLTFMSLEYHLFDDLPLNMCGKWIADESSVSSSSAQQQYNNANRKLDEGFQADDAIYDVAWDDDHYRYDSCPEDGSYAFTVSYKLPTADDSTSWLATGWNGNGEVMLFSEKYNTDAMVGYCTLHLATMVTPKSDGSFNPPSAMISALIMVATLAFMIFLCIYCTCCRSKSKPRRDVRDRDNDERLSREKHHNEDPIVQSRESGDYTQMEDEKKEWVTTY